MRFVWPMALWWLGLLGDTLARSVKPDSLSGGVVLSDTAGAVAGANPGNTLRDFRPPMALQDGQNDQETSAESLHPYHHPGFGEG